MRQHRRLFSSFAVILCVLFWTIPAQALTYYDDMADGAQNNIKNYSNLAYFPMDTPYWGSLPDKTAFTFANMANPVGAAVYRVREAQQVKVGVYTLSGVFASHFENGYALGLTNENLHMVRQAGQASFSPSAKGVYMQGENGLLRAEVTDWGIAFEPANENPSDLVGYAINIYSSADGRSWTRHRLTQSAVQFSPGAPFVYEEYTASVPGEATHIRVELNDVTQYPVQGKPGQYRRKVEKSFNCLASVTISGNNLSVGTPEPLLPEQPAQSSSSRPVEETESSQREYRAASQSGSAGRAASKEAASAPASGDGTSSAPAAAHSGSKFEGTITRSGSEGQGSAGRAAGSGAAAPETSMEPPAPPEEGIVYQVPAQTGGNSRFTAGVTVYIVGMVGILLFILLSAAWRRK